MKRYEKLFESEPTFAVGELEKQDEDAFKLIKRAGIKVGSVVKIKDPMGIGNYKITFLGIGDVGDQPYIIGKDPRNPKLGWSYGTAQFWKYYKEVN